MPRWVKELIVVIGLPSACLIAILALYGMMLRAGDHRWYGKISTEDGGIYTARYAWVSHDVLLLRIYRTGGTTILAERLYLAPGDDKLVWTENSVIYDTSGSDWLFGGSIQLPPTRWDRVLTYLPLP